jgi:hypothetical protein
MHVDVGFQGARCLIVESGPTRDSDGPGISTSHLQTSAWQGHHKGHESLVHVHITFRC